MTPHADTRAARGLVYTLLIGLAVGLSLGRIASVERVVEPSVHRADTDTTTPRPAWPSKRPEPWPTFGSNDRARWALARALVEEGTFVVGRRDRTVVVCSGPAVLAATNPFAASCLLAAGYQARISSDRGIIFEEGWQSVDKVLHPARLEYYSTKPPLLSLLVAGEYWLLKNYLGWSLVEQRWEIVRLTLVVFNVLPLIVYLLCLSALAERLASSDWARYYLLAAAGFATLVTPFLISLNNHTVATVAVAVALYAVIRTREGGGLAWPMLAGLAAGFAGVNELPSFALVAALAFWLLLAGHRAGLLVYVLAVLLPVAAYLGTNYLQLERLTPAYAEFGTVWYEYEGSHWRIPEGQTKRGIDFARRNGETWQTYAFHLTLGHHGWFSLTPIMFLGLVGLLLGMFTALARLASGSSISDSPDRVGNVIAPLSGFDRLLLFSLTLLMSLVVFAFYLLKSDNYGGWSNGPRWLMWLTPLWLLGMLPLLDRLAGSRLGRFVALVLLVASILSMSYQLWNPWRHPWIYNWMESRGWISY
jgi:hypothetical protein